MGEPRETNVFDSLVISKKGGKVRFPSNNAFAKLQSIVRNRKKLRTICLVTQGGQRIVQQF